MSETRVHGWDLPSVNRSALMVEAAQGYLDWARQCPDCDADVIGNGIGDEGTAYLIPEQAEDTPERWLKRNYQSIFEHELWAWCTDPAYWPANRSFRTFKQFFVIRFSSVVVDTARSPIGRGPD